MTMGELFGDGWTGEEGSGLKMRSLFSSDGAINQFVLLCTVSITHSIKLLLSTQNVSILTVDGVVRRNNI